MFSSFFMASIAVSSNFWTLLTGASSTFCWIFLDLSDITSSFALSIFFSSSSLSSFSSWTFNLVVFLSVLHWFLKRLKSQFHSSKKFDFEFVSILQNCPFVGELKPKTHELSECSKKQLSRKTNWGFSAGFVNSSENEERETYLQIFVFH